MGVWQNTQLLQTITGHRESVNAVAFNPDGQTFVSASSDHTIKLWGLETVELLHTFSQHTEAVCLSPDQGIIASNSQEQIQVWGFDSGELRHNLTGHGGIFYCLAISPDGQTLASGCEDYTIKLWNLKTGELIYTLGDDQSEFRGDTSPVYSVAFSPDGQTLISGQRNGMIKIWIANVLVWIVGFEIIDHVIESDPGTRDR